MIALALLLAAGADPGSIIPDIALWSTGVVDAALHEPPPPGYVTVMSMPEDFSRKTSAELVVAQLRNGRFVHLEPFGDASPTRPVLACVVAENDALHARVLLARGKGGAIVDTLVSLSPQTKRLVFARAAVVASIASVDNERAQLLRPSSKGDGVCQALDRAADGRVVVASTPVVVAPRETRARGVKAANGPELFERSAKDLAELAKPSWALLDALADADDLRAFVGPSASVTGADVDLLVAEAFDAQLRHVVAGRAAAAETTPTRAFVRVGASIVDVTFTGDAKASAGALALSWLARPNGGAVLLSAPSEPDLIDDTKPELVFFVKKDSRWTRVEPPAAPTGCAAERDRLRAWAKAVYVGQESYRAAFDGYTTDLKELGDVSKGDTELVLQVERAGPSSFLARLRYRGLEATVDENNAIVGVSDVCKPAVEARGAK